MSPEQRQDGLDTLVRLTNSSNGGDYITFCCPLQEKATSVYGVACSRLFGVEISCEFLGLFAIFLLDFGNAPNINNEANRADDASKQKCAPADPNHGDAKTGFWDCDCECGADKPCAKDNRADFVGIAGADALLIVFAVDKVPSNDQNVSQDYEGCSDVGRYDGEVCERIYEVVFRS